MTAAQPIAVLAEMDDHAADLARLRDRNAVLSGRPAVLEAERACHAEFYRARASEAEHPGAHAIRAMVDAATVTATDGPGTRAIWAAIDAARAMRDRDAGRE